MGETAKLSEQKQRSTGGLKWLREHANVALLLIDDVKLTAGRWTCATDQFVAVELSKMSEPAGFTISHKSVEAFRYENGRKSFERTRSVEIPPPLWRKAPPAADYNRRFTPDMDAVTPPPPETFTGLDELVGDYPEEPERPHFGWEDPVVTELRKTNGLLDRIAVALEKVTAK